MSTITKNISNILNDSSVRWGFRLAICVTLPLLYGHFFYQDENAFWMAIAAQSVALIEYRGSFSVRFRILLGSIFFVLFFGILGMIVGKNPLLHLILMFPVAMISALFKNLGERGIGMSLSIFILFILSAAYPSDDMLEIVSRGSYLLAGGILVFIVVISGTLVQKKHKPFYSFMANIFDQVKILADKQKAGWSNEGKFTSLHELYLQESKIRELINTFLNFYTQTIDTVSKKSPIDYNLATQRKTLILLYNIILSIHEQVFLLRKYKADPKVDTVVSSLLTHISIICHLGHRFYLSQHDEDYYLLQSRLAKLQKLRTHYKHTSWADPIVALSFRKIENNVNRIQLLLTKLLSEIKNIKPNPYYRYTSFSKIISILHPVKFGNEFANLLKFEKDTTYHAIRVGVAATIGLLIAQRFYPDHGYWIPFTAIIVAQPYASATLKRGIQRSIGTVIGIFIGYVLLLLPHPFYWNFIAIFISAFFSLYFMKKNYGITSMFMTLVVVGLISIKPPLDLSVLSSRIIATIIGSSIIILLNYVLFRKNEVKSIEDLMIRTLRDNYTYFINGVNSFQSNKNNWMLSKKNAENSTVTFFNTYNRLRIQINNKAINDRLPQYFSIITHLFRCNKELTEFFIAYELHQGRSNNLISIEHYYYEIKKLYQEIFLLLEQDFDIDTPMQNFHFDASQVNHLEKIILELNQIKIDLQ